MNTGDAIVDDAAVDEFAAALIEARRAGRGLDDAHAHAALRGVEAGRRALSRLTELLASENVLVAGIKLGALDVATQGALGLSEPLVAPFYDEWTMASGGHLSLSRLVAPKLECEVGFHRYRNRWTAVACIEVLDSRLSWAGRGGHVIADFGLNGAVVQGSRLGHAKDVTFELHHDGAVVVAGRVSTESSRERTEARTQGIDTPYVASGSLHPPVSLEVGEWTLRFSHGGEATLTVTG